MSDKWIDCSARTPICIKISSSKKILIEHERLKNQIEVLFPLKESIGVAKKWGDWIIECREEIIYLYLCDNDKPNDVIRITLDDIHSSSQIREEKNQGKVYELFGVQKLYFYSKGVIMAEREQTMSTLLYRFENSEISGNNLNRMNSEEIADVLLCLCNAALEGKLKKASPENIEIQEDGEVRVISSEELNLFYASPEEVMGISEANEDTGWFTLGLLAYFVINGRSYYLDRSINVVDINELKEKQSSMIMADGIEQSAEDINSLFAIAIENFTSWDAKKRSSGKKYLLKAIQQFASTAEVQYVCNGQPVLSDAISVNPPRYGIQKNSYVTGTDGRKYRILSDIVIPFRPGAHKVSVNVSSEEATQDDYFLCMQVENQSRMFPIIKYMGTQPQIKKIEIKRDLAVHYKFYIIVCDSVSKREIKREYKATVGVPPMPSGGSSLLQVKYEPETGVEIALYNRAGTKMISDNAIKFFVE